MKCNPNRFPAEFMFQLSWEQGTSLKSQSVTFNKATDTRGKHVIHRPFAFTEHGAILAAPVLNSLHPSPPIPVQTGRPAPPTGARSSLKVESTRKPAKNRRTHALA